jgi:transposase
VDDRVPYPSDVTDARWVVLEPFLLVWKAKHPSASGHQGRYELREMVSAIFYQNRTGCQWAYLPHDLPPKSATCYYFALWRDDGTDQAIHDLLRCQAREKAGRAEDPTVVVLDTQSIRAANHVPAATTGKDAGERVPGGKRGLAVDVLGLIIAVVVMAASATDNQIGVRLLDKVAAHTPTVTRAWVDSAPGSRTTWRSTVRCWASTSSRSSAATPGPATRQAQASRRPPGPHRDRAGPVRTRGHSTVHTGPRVGTLTHPQTRKRT